MTSLAPMNESEFVRFRESSLAHIVDLWPSLEAARREFDTGFPGGLHTPGFHLLTIRGGETVVGYALLQVKERTVGREAFLSEFGIYPEYRRRGHALKALRLLEGYAHGLGLPTFALSVREQNHAARALYAKAGFTSDFIRMTKKLS